MTSWVEGSGSYVITSQVEFGTDDALSSGATYPGTNTFADTATSLTIGQTTTTHYTPGLRFTDLPILKDAVIESAILSVYCSTSTGTGPLDVVIAGEAVDNAPEWTDAHRPSHAYAAKTTATVTETLGAAWTTSAWKSLSDIKSIIQEIVNRPGWAPRNALNLIIYPASSSLPGVNTFRAFRTFEQASIGTLSAKLVITVTGTGTAIAPRTYYLRADGTSSKTRSTSVASAATAMNNTVHTRESFSPGDTIILSSRGGDFTRTSTPVLYAGGAQAGSAATGLSGYPIKYVGEVGYTPKIDGENLRNNGVQIDNGRQFYEFENIFVTRAAISNVEWQGNSTGVMRTILSTLSGNQNFQQLGTSSVTYCDIQGDDAVDDGFSMHDAAQAVIHTGSFSGNGQGVNFIGPGSSLTGYDISIDDTTNESIWVADGGGGTMELVLERFSITNPAANKDAIKFDTGTTASLKYGYVSGAIGATFMAVRNGGTAEATLDHVVLYDGAKAGTGVGNDNTATLTLTNSVIVGYAVGLSNDNVTPPDAHHNAFYNNTADLSGATSTDSVLADPMFVDASAGDFHLDPRSPLINAGASTSVTTDYYGRMVPIGALPEIGLAEYVPANGYGVFNLKIGLGL